MFSSALRRAVRAARAFSISILIVPPSTPSER